MTKNRKNVAQETEQAILKVQRALGLMNAPHSYRLFSVKDLVQSATAQSPAHAGSEKRQPAVVLSLAGNAPSPIDGDAS